MQARTPGYMKVLSFSHRYVLSVQVDEYRGFDRLARAPRVS